jgi:hypothetical protein
MSVNLDLVRSIYSNWERGDYNDVAWAHHALEYVMAGGPDPGVWRGVRGMAEAFRGMLKAWTDWRVTADEYVEWTGSAYSCSTASPPAAGRADWRPGSCTRKGRHCSSCRRAELGESSSTSTASAPSPTSALLMRAAPGTRSRFRRWCPTQARERRPSALVQWTIGDSRGRLLRDFCIAPAKAIVSSSSAGALGRRPHRASARL